MTEENEKTPEISEESPAPILGKFESVDALARAYGELEAEFTRRSQRLKELEKRSKDVSEPQACGQTEVPSVRAECESDELYRNVMQNEGVRARVVSDFLGSLKGVPLMTGAGAGVTAPAQKPKSFAEAGSLALGYLKSKK